MSEHWIKQIIKLLINPPIHVAFAIFFTCFLITFIPPSRAIFGFDVIYENFQHVFSLLLVYSLFFIICYLSKIVATAVDRDFEKNKLEKAAEKAIQKKYKQLPDGEIELLRYMKSLPVDVAWIPAKNPAALSLLHKGLLELVISPSTFFKGKPPCRKRCLAYSIHPLLREYMNKSEAPPHV